MSADLLEAFGDLSQPTQSTSKAAPTDHTQKSSTPAFGSLSGATRAVPLHTPAWNDPVHFASGQDSTDVIDNDDDFGDFEDAEIAETSQTLSNIPRSGATPQLFSQQSAHGRYLVSGLNEPHRPLSVASNNIAANSEPSRVTDVAHHANARQQSRLNKIAPDPDVLFDAEDFDVADADDFGDFEGGDVFQNTNAQEQLKQMNAGGTDLLGLDDEFASLAMPNATSTARPAEPSTARMQATPSNYHEQARTQHAAPTPVPRKKTTAASFTPVMSRETKPVPQPPTAANDDGWDDFADWETSEPPKLTPSVKEDAQVAKIAKTVQSFDTEEPPTDDLPPTNVPPPAVVLSLFPQIIADAQSKVFKPVAAQSFQLKNRILSDPALGKFVKAYLLLGVVAARVIAGRRYRWKRDTHLSQSMRIGPASSRGSSGMKLTGVDKGEVNKEDRETLDVVRAWREQLGRLRSAIASVNSITTSSIGPIPELQETMPVRMVKDGEGGVAAPQPCALCGLKRNERVEKVDHDVQDSFGEWWIERSSMHRACRNFWIRHRDTLRQR